MVLPFVKKRKKEKKKKTMTQVEGTIDFSF